MTFNDHVYQSQIRPYEDELHHVAYFMMISAVSPDINMNSHTCLFKL